MSTRRFLTVALPLVVGLGLVMPVAAAPFELKDGDVVAFVGGTDLVRIQKDGYLEASLTRRFWKQRPKFRDLAWDGDTAYFQSTVRERWRGDAFGDWRAQLKRVGATVVIAQFGKIESLDGEQRVDEFETAYADLLEQLAADGRRVILLAPSPFEKGWGDAVARAELDVYTQAIKKLAAEKRVPFVSHSGVDPARDFASQLTGGIEAGEKLPARGPRETPPVVRLLAPGKLEMLVRRRRQTRFQQRGGRAAVVQGRMVNLPRPDRRGRGKNLPLRRRSFRRKRRSSPGRAEADVGRELAAFNTLDGWEVNLFADESHGIANPLSLRWDAEGRMYVACSDATRRSNRARCLMTASSGWSIPTATGGRTNRRCSPVA